MQLTKTTAVAVLALLSSCAMTSSIGYGDGWVTSSPVSYHFVGPPVLQDVTGKSYRVQAHGTHGSQTCSIASFDEHGMQATQGRSNYDVRIELGAVKQGKPGAMQLGKKWYPAFSVTVPYNIEIAEVGGKTLTERSGTYDNVLTFRQMQSFQSREEAVKAIDTIRKLAQKGIDENALTGAWKEATDTTNTVAARLFQERNISVEVPVVRSAAGLDMEACYQMLTEATTPEQVQRALTAYETLGMAHVKEDGTPNNTANYGVACGIAACQLMLRDLAGAWETGDVASGFERNGQEISKIRSVIFKQEYITGEKVIPSKDREQIDRANELSNALQGLVGSPPK